MKKVKRRETNKKEINERNEYGEKGEKQILRGNGKK